MKNKYTFDNFIVSDCNVNAYNACENILKSAHGQLLFLYGASGFGKTHLLFSVLNKFKQNSHGENALMLSCEEFLAGCTDSVVSSRTDTFLKELDSFDLLIIDNFQSVCGKSIIMSYIGSIFYSLLEKGKRIVVASDRSEMHFQDFFAEIKMATIVNLEKPDDIVRTKLIDRLLKEKSISLPDFIKECVVKTTSVSLSSFKGFVSKIHLFISQKANFTENDLLKCLSDYGYYK